MKLQEDQKSTKCKKNSIKYFGIFMDCNLNWKDRVPELSKTISSSIGILLKLRNFVTIDILIQVYYSIIYPFLIYGILVWGNTYKTNIEPLVILQKKAIRIITFSPYRSHTSHNFSYFSWTQEKCIPLSGPARGFRDHVNGSLDGMLGSRNCSWLDFFNSDNETIYERLLNVTVIL